MVPDHQEKVRLGCVLLSISRPVSVLDAETYRLLGVRWYGNGCHEHSVHQGRELKTQAALWPKSQTQSTYHGRSTAPHSGLALRRA